MVIYSRFIKEIYIVFCIFFSSTSFAQTIGFCFFDDHGEGSQWISLANSDSQGAVKSNFLKTLSAKTKAENIFVTPSILFSFLSARSRFLAQLRNSLGVQNPLGELSIENRGVYRANGDLLGSSAYFQGLNNATGVPELFCFDPNAWELYDTHTGLFLLHARHAPTVGLNISNFTRLNINNPGDSQTYYEHWTDGLYYIFDTRSWRISQNKACVFLNGHGSERSMQDYRNESACGMPVTSFARFLKFMNDEFPVTFLGVISCHWTAQRAAELMQKQYNYDFLNFGIISLIKTEQAAYTTSLGAIRRFNAVTRSPQFDTPYCVFYDALYDATELYNGYITSQIAQNIGRIDDLHISQITHQRQASCVLPGGQLSQVI